MFFLIMQKVFMLDLLVLQLLATKRKLFGCQRPWSLTSKDPSKVGYLKEIDFLLYVNYKASGNHWVLDSGCTQHMTGDMKMFTQMSEEDFSNYDSITFGDNRKGKVKGLGKIAISNDHSISNVLLVESLNFNLLFVAQLCDLGFSCNFTVDDVIISSVDSSNLKFKVFRHENLYLVDFSSSEAKLSTCLFSKASLGWLWHRRLGHVVMKQLNWLTKHDLVRGLKDVKFEKNKMCSSCQAGKQVANTHPNKSQMSTHRPLELLHMDLFGPTSFVSIGGNSYYLVIVDDYYRFTWVYCNTPGVTVTKT
jgi:hypothetical protein